jgi:hypothetical protein
MFKIICGQTKIKKFTCHSSINIWASVCDDNTFGPHIIPNRLTARNYKTLLENKMPYFLDDMPLIICQELHFTHGVLVACGYLNKKFPGW